MDNIPSGAGWQVLGELQLPASANVNKTLVAWLAQVMVPFEFQPDFSARLVDSAQDAVDHVTAQGADPGRLRILVFSRLQQVDCALNWGFFHLERASTSEHIIELYLYPEG